MTKNCFSGFYDKHNHTIIHFKTDEQKQNIKYLNVSFKVSGLVIDEMDGINININILQQFENNRI